MDYPFKIKARVTGHQLGENGQIVSTITFNDLPDSSWRQIVVNEMIEIGTDLIITVSEDKEVLPY